MLVASSGVEATNMTTRFGFQKMDAYQVAKQLAVSVHRGKIKHTELRDQAERAAVSAFLQLSEGLPNDSPGMRRRYFTIARNSLCELVAAIDLATALGALDADAARAIEELAGSLRGMLVALLR